MRCFEAGGVAIPLFRVTAETVSTNDDVAALARAGAAEGTWLRADRQTAGRGRQGRGWVSPPGNFYGSTLVRLTGGEAPAPTLALVAAVALHDAVSAFGAASAVLKWPNDLLVGGAKLSGILLERTGDAVVIGFGVNLAHHPVDLDRPATSVAAATGAAPDPDVFLATLAASLARWLIVWRDGGLGPLRAAWLDRAHPVGSRLAARIPSREAQDAVIHGSFDGLDEGGALRLRLADGTVRVIHAADVFMIQD